MRAHLRTLRDVFYRKYQNRVNFFFLFPAYSVAPMKGRPPANPFIVYRRGEFFMGLLNPENDFDCLPLLCQRACLVDIVQFKSMANDWLDLNFTLSIYIQCQ